MKRLRNIALWGAGLLVLALTSCSSPEDKDSSAAAYQRYLYITDTTNGHVSYFDPETDHAASTSLLTTAGSAGEIQFYQGLGYVAVGSGDDAGVYGFDPSAQVPSATLLTGTDGLNAQYFAFVSKTQAYFTVAGNYASNLGGVYRFNPSNWGAGVTRVDEADLTEYFQEIALGGDGQLYVAANQSSPATVYRFDPATDQKTASFTLTSSAPTGIVAGTYAEASGVFVTATGSWGASDGAIEFIAEDAEDGDTAVTVVSGLTNPTRVLVAGTNLLAVTGWSKTYLADLSASSPTATEVKSGTTSFAGGSLSLADGVVWVPTSDYMGTSLLYGFTTAGTQVSGSPFSIMVAGDNATNAAFYR